MSPRRKVDAEEADYFEVKPKPPRRWGLPIVAGVATLVIAAAVASSVFMLVHHEQDSRAQFRAAAALTYVRGFMTTYTTVDPFHANEYADRVLAQGTGQFAQSFRDRLNEIVLTVAQAEPTTGSVVEAGIQRWNDNGSADVLVATKVTTTAPDGKTTIESGNRWVATAVQEGQQWKISQLIQVL